MNNLVQKTAARLLKRLAEPAPEVAIVLGSGFNGVLRHLEVIVEIGYEDLPGFPRPRVHGHAGDLLLGRVNGVTVIVMRGRAHFYEGHSMDEITFPIRVLAETGVRTLVLTNAAGGINPRFRPGDLMCLTDHINFMGANPLRGDGSSTKPAFLDLSGVYDPVLIQSLKVAARHVKVRLHSGTYVAVAGPSYETPAEVKAFARLGGDAVGMSTVPEAIVARHCGMHVAAVSCITNMAAGRSKKPISHAEVLSMGERVENLMSSLLGKFVESYSASETLPKVQAR